MKGANRLLGYNSPSIWNKSNQLALTTKSINLVF